MNGAGLCLNAYTMSILSGHVTAPHFFLYPTGHGGAWGAKYGLQPRSQAKHAGATLFDGGLCHLTDFRGTGKQRANVKVMDIVHVLLD